MAGNKGGVDRLELAGTRPTKRDKRRVNIHVNDKHCCHPSALNRTSVKDSVNDQWRYWNRAAQWTSACRQPFHISLQISL